MRVQLKLFRANPRSLNPRRSLLLLPELPVLRGGFLAVLLGPVDPVRREILPRRLLEREVRVVADEAVVVVDQLRERRDRRVAGDPAERERRLGARRELLVRGDLLERRDRLLVARRPEHPADRLEDRRREMER